MGQMFSFMGQASSKSCLSNCLTEMYKQSGLQNTDPLLYQSFFLIENVFFFLWKNEGVALSGACKNKKPAQTEVSFKTS